MIDFSKHNKGLRFVATLLDINPDVFDTDTFIDIEYKGCYLYIYYNHLYDNYIKKLLITNRYYYNEQICSFKEHNYHTYIFVYEPNTVHFTFIGNNILNSNLEITDSFYVEVCIHWKKYLDKSFLDLCTDKYWNL